MRVDSITSLRGNNKVFNGTRFRDLDGEKSDKDNYYNSYQYRGTTRDKRPEKVNELNVLVDTYLKLKAACLTDDLAEKIDDC